MKKLGIIFSIFLPILALVMVITQAYAFTFANQNTTMAGEEPTTSLGVRLWGGYALYTDADGNIVKTGNSINMEFEGAGLTKDVNAGIRLANEYCFSGDVNSLENITPLIINNGVNTAAPYRRLYICIKNTGTKYLIPKVECNVEGYEVTQEAYYFNTAQAETGNEYKIEPTAKKNSLGNASDKRVGLAIDSIETAIKAYEDNTNPTNITKVLTNTCLDEEDEYVLKITIKKNNDAISLIPIDLNINILADVDHNKDNVLTVKQEVVTSGNQDVPDWIKVGHNNTLVTNTNTATKVDKSLVNTVLNRDNSEELTINKLKQVLVKDASTRTDTYTNSQNEKTFAGNVVTSTDPYLNQVVYKDIDLVNIDINTGEPIGKLSDVSYNFEWYGGNVTLPSGTTLASGRKLTSQETFTVDVYTHYPTFYIRRWMVNNTQWITISNEYFIESTKIEGYYTATFEATLFQPYLDNNGTPYYYYVNSDGIALKEDGTTITAAGQEYISTNKNISTLGTTSCTYQNCYEVAYTTFSDGTKGIIPRSYVYDMSPLTSTSTSYLMTNYLYKDNTGLTSTSSGRKNKATASTNQQQMLDWSTNLTFKWKEQKQTNPSKFVSRAGYLPNASISQGENYTAYIYNWLYTVKYANNNAQNTVGWGNVNTNSKSANTKTPLSSSSTAGDNYLRAQKGGSTIGVLNTNDPLKSTTGGMAYGHSVNECLDGNRIGKKGIYAHQFLTYGINNNQSGTPTKRVLLDGYVGSNECTQVFCLGLANPWGNIWKWVFGVAINGISITDGSTTTYEIKANVNYNNYQASYNSNGTVANSNWCTDNSRSVYNAGDGALQTLTSSNTLKKSYQGYQQLSYNLPQTSAWYSYNGISEATTSNKQSLIGMPTSTSKKASSNGSKGLCDYYYVATAANYTNTTFGVLRGGITDYSPNAGPFYFHVRNAIPDTGVSFGFRNMFVS